jgi:hypothetical protein
LHSSPNVLSMASSLKVLSSYSLPDFPCCAAVAGLPMFYPWPPASKTRAATPT